MAKFMFLQRGGDCQSHSEMSPEEMQASMEKWMNWVKAGTDAGWLIDPGGGLSGASAVVGADMSVKDGPFSESKEIVGGYCMVEAANLDEALIRAKETAAMAGNGTIEVREVACNEE